MKLSEAERVFNVTCGKYSLETIHKIYRTLARVVHPDVGGATDSWSHLQDAYNVLKSHIEKGRKCPTCNGEGSTSRMMRGQVVIKVCHECGGRKRI